MAAARLCVAQERQRGLNGLWPLCGGSQREEAAGTTPRRGYVAALPGGGAQHFQDAAPVSFQQQLEINL